jgi:quinolinate synthase
MNNNNSEKNLVQKILELKKQKNAVILAHFYQNSEIQDIADFVGDSLKLSQEAAETKADIIVFAGVHFMAETAKILSPDKKVLLPDLEAGCSLADSCEIEDFKKFKLLHPNHIVISYVNTTAEIKAETDIVCTSTNALKIVESLPLDQKIIFAPDRNLGNYINSITNREMVLWDGACHVHDDFSLERILELKQSNLDAKIIAHPECQKQILIVSDYVGSTLDLLNFTKSDKSDKYIIATESGVIHQMKKANPQKTFIPAPPNDVTCACNDCKYMKLITLQKLYDCLLNETPEIFVEETVRLKAEKSIRRMLDLSKSFNL